MWLMKSSINTEQYTQYNHNNITISSNDGLMSLSLTKSYLFCIRLPLNVLKDLFCEIQK